MDERECILVVDDDRTHLDMAQTLLNEYFDVMPATSGAHALDMLRGGALPALILLDIDMPGLDGYETCARIRAMAALEDTPVIFLTGMTNSEYEFNGLTLGAQDYITKPFARDNLLARIRLRLGEARRVRHMRTRLRAAGVDEQRLAGLEPQLSPTELDVVRLISKGCGNKEIARRLNYSIGYVNNIATAVYDKLGVRGRTELRKRLMSGG